MFDKNDPSFQKLWVDLKPLYERYRVKDAQHGRKISKELILVDYKPVTRIINNSIHYAFLRLDTDSISVIFKRSYRSADENYMDTPAKAKAYTQLLFDFDRGFSDTRFIRESLVDLGIEHEFTDVPVTLKYIGVIPEINAVLIFTSAFESLHDTIRNNLATDDFMNKWGYKITGGEYDERELMNLIYNNRMILSNLDMGEYYSRFYSKSITENLKLFNILTEFIPMYYKFENIYNPLLTQEVQMKFDHLKTELTNVDMSDFYNSIIKGKLRPVDKSERYILWTRRLLYYIVTGIMVNSVRDGAQQDEYSFKFFNTMIYDLMLHAVDDKMFFDATGKYYLYYMRNENDTVQITYIGKHRRVKNMGSESEEEIDGIAAAKVLYQLRFANSVVTLADLGSWIANAKRLPLTVLSRVELE